MNIELLVKKTSNNILFNNEVNNFKITLV